MSSLGYKIRWISFWYVFLISYEVYYMVEGKICDMVEMVVLVVEIDMGFIGWGEVCLILYYLFVYVWGVVLVIIEFVLVFIGVDLVGFEVVIVKVDVYL